VSEHDLANLGRFHIATRLVLDSEETAPFTVVTEKLPPAIPGRAKLIRRLAKANARPPNAEPQYSASELPRDPRRAA
jgi:hypothetical protein